MRLILPNPKYFSKAFLVGWILKPLLRPAYWTLLLLRKFIPGYRRLPKFLQEAIAILLIFTTIFGSLAGFISFNPWIEKTEAAWFNEEWGYRKPITFTHNANVSNTYVQLDVDTTAAPDQIQADCGDIRFTDISGNLLRYYLDSGAGACDTNSTDFDVLIPSIVNGLNTIYIYYGNSSVVNGTEATSLSAQGFSETSPSGGAPSVGSEAKAESPVAYWKFDDAQGTTAQDSTPNNLDATLAASTATPTWQSEDLCISGKCLKFDGGDEVTRATSSSIVFNSSFTISAWVKVFSYPSSNAVVVLKRNNTVSNHNYYLDVTSTGKVFTGFYNGSTWSETNNAAGLTLSRNQWYYLTGVFDDSANTLTTYINGQQNSQATGITGTPYTTNPADLEIGFNSDNTEHLTGSMDEIRLYNYARTAAQIKADFNARGNPDASAVLGASNNQPGALSNGLVGYWKMDETSSWATDCSTESVLDSSGNFNDGAPCPNTSAATQVTTAKFGKAADFDGTNDYIDIDDTTSLDVTRITIAAWIRPETTGTQERMISKWGNTDGEVSYVITNDNNNKFRIGVYAGGNYDVCDASSSYSINTWYFVTGTYDGNTCRMYINGQDVTTLIGDSASGDIQNTTTQLRFGVEGDDGTTSPFAGQIDEARIYNRALSSYEISRLYNFAPGPVAYWKLDEGSGNVADSSGNGNNGTATGTTSVSGKFGKARRFSGTNDINAGNTSTLDITGAAITLEGWVFAYAWPGGGQYPAIFSKANNSIPYGGYQLNLDSGSGNKFTLALNLGGSWTTLNTTNTFSTNTWYHVAGVLDSSGMKIYVNGVLDNSNSSTGNIGTRAVNLLLGKNGGQGDVLNGSLDDLKIYNYARTQRQIIEDMNGGHPVPGSPVGTAVAHWRFDEGTGTAAYDTNASTGGSEDLTLSSASWNLSGKFGKAWNGDGTIWASRATDADLEFSATDDFSISGWFKTDSSTNPANGIEYLVSDTAANTDAGFSIYANTDGTICFGIDDDATWGPDVASCTTTDYYDGTWHYFTAVRNTVADTTKIYVDGAQKDSDLDTTTATLDGNNTFYIGDFDGDNNATAGIEEFAGDIDELKVFRSALTDDQIKVDMNQGKSQILGALGDNSNYDKNAANQEYCVPGDSTSCAAPVGRWDFEEGSGSSAFDTSGNSYTGTITNATYTRSKDSKGLSFVNSGANVAISTQAALSPETGTIELWANFNDITTSGYLFSMGPDEQSIYFNGTNIRTYYDSVATSTISPPAVKTWTHIAFTFVRGGSCLVYLNGTQVASDTCSSTAPTAAAIKFGAQSDNGAAVFNGKLDQVRIFNYARTPDQIAWDYNKGAPIAHWRMDECQGTSLTDSTGNGNTATLDLGASGTTSAGTCITSGAWFNGVSGKRNYSLDFDGADDIASITEGVSMDYLDNIGATTDSYSVSAWIKTSTDGSGQYVVSKDDATGAFPFALYLNTSEQPAFEIYDGTNQPIANGTTALNDGVWHHLVGIRDVTNDLLRIYVDGIQVDTSSDSTTATTANDDSLYIGSRGNNAQDFDGQIDDVRIYNYTLTATQVKNLMNEGAVRFGPVTGAP